MTAGRNVTCQSVKSEKKKEKEKIQFRKTTSVLVVIDVEEVVFKNDIFEEQVCLSFTGEPDQTRGFKKYK